MKYDIVKRHRRSIRLKGFDYRQAGGYFVTIVTKDRLGLFGEIVDGEVRLNDAGRIIQTVWNDLPNHYRTSNATRLWSCRTTFMGSSCW